MRTAQQELDLMLALKAVSDWMDSEWVDHWIAVAQAEVEKTR